MNHRSLSLRRILLTVLMLIGLLANNVSIARATTRPPIGQQRPPLSTLEGANLLDPATPPFSPTL